MQRVTIEFWMYLGGLLSTQETSTSLLTLLLCFDGCTLQAEHFLILPIRSYFYSTFLRFLNSFHPSIPPYFLPAPTVVDRVQQVSRSNYRRQRGGTVKNVCLSHFELSCIYLDYFQYRKEHL